MPVDLKLGGFFDKAKRDKAAQNAVSKSIREFAIHVPEQQKKSKASGKIRKKGRGRGFTHSHRASAKGQRPAPDSGKLLRSTKHKMTGRFSGEVTTIAKNNSFDYASQLQEKMDRPIQNAPEDTKAAQAILDKNAEREMSKL